MPSFRTTEPPPPHYAPDQLGGLCRECGNPIPATLTGMDTHPTCDPDWKPMLAASKRAQARLAARRKLETETTP